MDDFNAHLENLNADIRSQRAIFLVGAGISFNSGTPIVKHFYEELAKTLGVTIDELLLLIANKPFESVIYILFMNTDVKNHFKRFFDQKIPTATHFYLANQFLTRNIDIILTTNFDQLVEIAYEQISKEKLSKVYPANFSVYPFPTKSNAIVKLHGCISEDLNSLGVTIDAVANSKNRANIKSILRKIILKGERKSLIIMGYSGLDIFDINPALEEILDESIFIYRIQHANPGTYVVRQLTEPFQNFKGIELVCNTDQLISKIWGDTIPTPYLKNSSGINLDDWKKAFADWKKDIAPFKGLKEYEFLGHCGQTLASNLDLSIEYGRLALKVLREHDHFGHPDWSAVIKTQLAQRLKVQFESTNEKSAIEEATILANEAVQFFDSNLGRAELLRLLRLKSPPDKNDVETADQYCMALGAQGLVFRIQGRILEARDIYEMIISICELSGNNQYRAATLMGLGYIYLNHIDVNRAISYYEKAVEINEEYHYPFTLTQSYFGLSNSYTTAAMNAGDETIQARYFQKALEVAKRALDWTSKVDVQLNERASKKVKDIEQLMREMKNRF